MDQKNSTLIISVIRGVVIGVVVTLALSFITAILVSGETIKMDMLVWVAPVINFVSTMSGCTVAAKKEKAMLAILCGSICGVYLLIMILTGLAVYGRLGTDWWHGTLAALIGGACVSLFSARKPVKKRKYR